MKITRLETTVFEPKWDDPFAAWLRRTHAAIKVHTDEGLVGISRSGGDSARLIHEYLEPALVGEDPCNVERLWAKMSEAAFSLGAGAVGIIGSLDIALWDLLGKSAGLPCWQLLGGYRDWAQAYADVPTRAKTPAELGEQLAAAVAMGYEAVKFHVLQRNPRPDDVVAQTKAARAGIGPDVRLMVDVARGLDPRTAIDVAQRMEEYDVFWLEEPVRWYDQPLGLALVARNTRIAVAGGEGEHSIHGCREILEKGGLTYLQADIIGAGGYTNWRKIAGLAEAYHVKIAPHGASFPELNAHLVAAMPHGVMVSTFTPGQPPEVWSRMYQDFRIEHGRIQLTRKPGLGLEFDEDYIARHQVAATGS